MAKVASTPPFEPHPARDSVLLEAHSRPFFSIFGSVAPDRPRLPAWQRTAGGSARAARQFRALAWPLARTGGREASSARASAGPFPLGRAHRIHHLRVPALGRARPFRIARGRLMRNLPLPEQPGPHLVSIDIAFVEDPEGDAALAACASPSLALDRRGWHGRDRFGFRA